jgi:hypothetical protein
MERKSVAALIEELARKTGASEAYVTKVRALLARRGIRLDEDAAPYRAALEHAFRRQEEIRRQVHQVAEQISRLYRGESRQSSERYGLEPRDVEDPYDVGRRFRGERAAARRIPIETEERHPLVRGERDRPMVPGPDSLQ